MIHVYLDPNPNALDVIGSPISNARPKALALVHLPRFHPPIGEWDWNAGHVVNFIIDTGADSTSIDIEDAVSLFPVGKFAELTDVRKFTGIGGQEVSYAIDRATLYFLHTNGQASPVTLDLGIARPPDRVINSGNVPDDLLADNQALLGRDLMTRFKVDVDYTADPTPYVRMWDTGTEIVDINFTDHV